MLHSRLLLSAEQRARVHDSLASLKPRFRTAQADAVGLVLTTVSANSSFDASVQIRCVNDRNYHLMLVDSGNSSLVMPSYSCLQMLPGFGENYQTLLEGTTEPFGNPACILQGPIQLRATDGSDYTISNCVFYACTSDDPREQTSNFGIGCIRPWPTFGEAAVPIKVPLCYDPDYGCAIVDYVDPSTVLSFSDEPRVDATSQLTLCRRLPEDFEILQLVGNNTWMTLTPEALAIGDTETQWPVAADQPMAMVDTGGGPAFLSDPEGMLYKREWPPTVSNPCWAATSSHCTSTQSGVTISLGDGRKTYRYTISPAEIPNLSTFPTLVICENCNYMFGRYGMNTGGISALFNFIGIDYRANAVGFKAKLL